MKKRMPRRPRVRIAALFLVLLLATGCWDRTEVNDIAIVMAAAIDKDKEGYRVSVMIPLVGNMGGATGGGGGSGGDRPYTIDSDTGRTIREASERMQARMARRLFYGHRKVLLIGEELAKENLPDALDITARLAENRLTSFMAVTKGNAYEMLNAAPKLERFPAEALRELLKSDGVIKIQVKDVAHQLNVQGKDAILPYVEVVKSKGSSKPNEEIQIGGYAYARQGKMIGVAREDEAVGIRWLSRSTFKPYLETVETDQGPVSVTIRRGKCTIKPYLSDGILHYRIEVAGEGTILEALDNKEYEHKNAVELLEQRLESKIAGEIRTVERLAKQRQVDIPGFGLLFNRAYPTLWKREWSSRWPAALEGAQYEVKVHIVINRTGMFSKNIGLKEHPHE
ncbi:MAG: hypothetical protein K0Q94_1754 [Paenibacillus sp.]|jgi:Ger(x)C family germination protein|uniref:Ger(x)C family spore germination protein n=1 Tax=Paenibacillus sp. GCM10012303 TaxID=3317340 RepID=UPI0029E8FCA8|nr:hypothetical protein [Paenibacillus sp.]